jgi:hypothetical protein
VLLAVLLPGIARVAEVLPLERERLGDLLAVFRPGAQPVVDVLDPRVQVGILDRVALAALLPLVETATIDARACGTSRSFYRRGPVRD